MTEEHAVDVKFKDFLFGQSRLNFESEQNLGEFSEKGLVEGQKIVASHLHGQRRAAATFFPCEHQFRYGPQQTQRFDAAVLKKTIVLGRQQGVDKALWDLLKLQRFSFLLAKLTNQCAVSAEHAHRGAQRNVAQRALLRQVGAQVEIQAGHPPHRSAGQQGTVEQQWSSF